MSGNVKSWTTWNNKLKSLDLDFNRQGNECHGVPYSISLLISLSHFVNLSLTKYGLGPIIQGGL